MKTLVIQRGHVPRTTGYTGTAGEQEVVTAIAAEAVRIGPPAGWQLRVIDADEPDYRYRGDAFIALHCDGSTNRAMSGASVGYQTPEGEAFAKRWKAAYAAHGWPHGFKADNYTENLRDYYGFRHALAVGNRACMVAEHGYLTNATDAAWIRAHITECARAIMAALPGEEETDMLDCYEITVVATSTAALARLRAKCRALGLIDPAVIEVVTGSAYVAKTHARKEPGPNKAEELAEWVKTDAELIAFKGVPTSAGTVASIGVVREGKWPAPLPAASCDIDTAGVAAHARQIIEMVE
jgi:hypothetical protein